MKPNKYFALGMFLVFSLLIFSCNSRADTYHKTKYSSIEKASVGIQPIVKINHVDYAMVGYDYSGVIKENPVIFYGFDLFQISAVDVAFEITARSNSPPRGINI